MAHVFRTHIRDGLGVACWILFVCSLGFPQSVAQDNPRDITEIPLEELNKLEVYSASKFSQKASEAPASISIVTAADIEHYGYRTFDDILRATTGFFITNDRNYAYLGARGFGLTGDYNSRVLVLINGHRTNDTVYGSSAVGTDFPIPMDLIDRIEIVRGPGSSLYGTNAFFAVINVIPKRGRVFDGGYVSAEAGSRQAYRGTATFGEKYDSGLEILFSGSYLNSKGYRRLYFPEFDSPETNNGIAEDADTDRSGTFFADVSFRGFSTQLVYGSREKRFPTAAFGTAFNDRRTVVEDIKWYLDFKYERTFRDSWNLLARTFIDAYDSYGSYIYDYSTGDEPLLVNNRDIVHSKWWGGEAQLTRIIAGKHHLTAGTEWRYSFRANLLNYDEDEYFLYLDSDIKTTDSAVYFQGEFAARDNILLSAGVRYDHYDTFGGTTNPRVAVVYSPRKHTTAKVLYGDAFRAPNHFELFYEDNVSGKGNPNLRPENIRTVELILEHYLSRKLRISGSAYQYKVKNQIIQELDPADGLIFYRNFGTTDAHGAELELEGRDVCGLDGRLSYALQSTENQESMASLVNSPHHIAMMKLFAPWLGGRGGAGLEMRYVSSRKTLGDRHVGGFFLTNINVLYKKLLPGLDLSAGLYNVFNRKYYHPGSAEHIQDALQQDGRSFRVRLGYGFSVQ